MNKKVIYYAITVALGGFLFGFDTAVISGAEQSIQKLWDLDTIAHGLTVSIALFGTMFGALFGGIPAHKYGRKNTLIVIGILYFVSALGSAVTENWYLFLFYRFIGGLGVGASSVAAPMYVSEISPANARGRLVALFQFNIVFGILIAFLSNYLIAGMEIVNDWRYMLGVESLPAIIFTFLMLKVPESPRWLIVKRGDVDQARRIFLLIGESNIKERLAQIGKAIDTREKSKINWSLYRRPIVLAILFAFFNQVSGINAIIYYAPRIFEMTGLGKSSALLSSVGIGAVNFIFTLLALNFIDRLGRKILMHIGSFGLICTLGLVAYAFKFTSVQTMAVPLYLFAYIGFFAFSQGAVIWVFISEIFPNEVRAFGQSLGSFTHWLMAAIISFTFPAFTELLGPSMTFLVFAIMMIFQWVFVAVAMPETGGKSLEELGDNLTK
ncbi:MAG: sugar porter family MFS transporter [Cyclobacteriaceae bacterium]